MKIKELFYIETRKDLRSGLVWGRLRLILSEAQVLNKELREVDFDLDQSTCGTGNAFIKLVGGISKTKLELHAGVLPDIPLYRAFYLESIITAGSRKSRKRFLEGRPLVFGSTITHDFLLQYEQFNHGNSEKAD